MPTVEQVRAEKRLVQRVARRRIDDRELDRAIYDAARNAHLSQRRISELLSGFASQATIQRTLRKLEYNPDLLRETPAGVIDHRTAGLIDDDQMMDRLLNWSFTIGRVPSVNGIATDAYMSGDWDDVELAFYRGLLSDDEFTRLMDRQKEHLERAARLR